MLYYRRKVMLAVLQMWGGRLSRIDFEKILFLFTLRQTKPAFDFVPYRFGCFSFQSYADLRAMTMTKLIMSNEEGFHAEGSEYFSLLTKEDQRLLSQLHKEITGLTGDALVHHVYTLAPYYATRSEIANRFLSEKELQAVDQVRPKQASHLLNTLGYEGISLDTYLNRLYQNGIQVLCDVRKNPMSMKYGFSKAQLSQAVERLGLTYLHFPELGIESDARQNLKTFDDYQMLFAQYEKTTLQSAPARSAIAKILTIMNSGHAVALTCFEADPAWCHRSRVAKALGDNPKHLVE